MALAAETQKHFRMLELLLRLQQGELLKKAELVQQFGVTDRSFQRDIDDIRAFLSDHDNLDSAERELIYDYKLKGYRLTGVEKHELTDGEALAVCKILLESRSLRRDELFPILEKIIMGCIPANNQKQAAQLISNEKFLYIEPRHGKPLIEMLWQIGQSVMEQQYLVIEYQRLKDKATVSRLVKPVGIMFSEFYFYMTAYIEHLDRNDEHADTLYPTIYRIDRISSCKPLNEHFKIPYKDRFQEGEFRKRVQFMFGGELKTVRFQFSGLSVEAVLDRLPTAKVLEEKGGNYVIEAEVFGDGIDMWIKSQGESITML